jgi:hypothetical protein
MTLNFDEFKEKVWDIFENYGEVSLEFTNMVTNDPYYNCRLNGDHRKYIMYNLRTGNWIIGGLIEVQSKGLCLEDIFNDTITTVGHFW